ncbi:sensor histidine kinase [Chitinasiproducens palmae]|uniref:sensor histidine kinase n=1 Tax=Chitinasiproducens palmae TaxID=1770053 RepID=UPI001F21A12D|nr:sensor histidine kinase [Chitinasiproducens palmae]
MQAAGTRAGDARDAGSHSLFGEILDWLLAPLLLLWPLSIAVTYLIAKSIANTPFDNALEARARVLAHAVQRADSDTPLLLSPSTLEAIQGTENDRTLYRIGTTDGVTLAGDARLSAPTRVAILTGRADETFGGLSDASTAIGTAIERETATKSASASASASASRRTTARTPSPIRPAVQLQDVTIAGEEMRTATLSVEDSRTGERRWIQLAEPTRARASLANDIIKGVILPQFLILPLAIVLVWFGLSRGLAPLHALRGNLRGRRPDDLSQLSTEQAPHEIAPLLASFNDLLSRLEANNAAQKRFIAQAAHQMKTPLAGLRMQAELALSQSSPTEVHHSLSQIAASSEHAARLVTQLLSLARAEYRSAQAPERLDLVALVRMVVHEWVPPALAKSMDIGFEADETAVQIEGQAVLLGEMTGNLIDNAIRYTPAGGRITVSVHAVGGQALLQVEDTGPGIPVELRERVVERFYRILGHGGEGSGLGLAIVKEIAESHGGRLAIGGAADETMAGTRMQVTLPLYEPPSSLIDAA